MPSMLVCQFQMFYRYGLVIIVQKIDSVINDYQEFVLSATISFRAVLLKKVRGGEGLEFLTPTGTSHLIFPLPVHCF